MSTTLPSHLMQLENNLHQLQRRKNIYTFASIGLCVAIATIGIDMANQTNATSFWIGVVKIFDFPIDMIVMAIEIGLWKWLRRIAEFIPDLLLTFNMAFLATALSFTFALILSVFASSNLVSNRYIVNGTRRILDLCRSFPEIVLALVLLYLMGKSLLPAIIAITIHSTGALGKLFSEAIENIDDKPLDGLTAVGASWISRVRFAVFTQVWPIFYSYTILRLEINVRASTILGFFGAGGIGQALNNNIQWRDGGRVTAIFLLLIVTIVILDCLSAWVRARMIGAKL